MSTLGDAADVNPVIKFLPHTCNVHCRCIVPKAVYTVKKCSYGWANLSPETCRAELKRLINEKVVGSCWLFTSLYYIVKVFIVQYDLSVKLRNMFIISLFFVCVCVCVCVCVKNSLLKCVQAF